MTGKKLDEFLKKYKHLEEFEEVPEISDGSWTWDNGESFSIKLGESWVSSGNVKVEINEDGSLNIIYE